MSNSESRLQVKIESFSYRKGIPAGDPENGGGFVFDCRCLPNPGREDQYKSLTGKDSSVKEFLDVRPEVTQFKESVFSIIDQVIESYQNRGFTNLSVAFGCTGGQHRSVYFTERLKDYLQGRANIEVKVSHREFP